MRSVEVAFGDRYGLHPRAAFRIQSAARAFRSSIKLEPAPGGTIIDTGSMMSLVSSGIRTKDRVTVSASGPDEDEAAAKLGDLIASGVCHP